MIPEETLNCPCERMCKQRREISVNFVFKKELCTANELKKGLLKKGLGISTIRRNLRFLCKECAQINVLADPNTKKPIQFKKQGRIFFVKTISKHRLLMKIRRYFLTLLQREVLRKFARHHKTIYYFSLYELKKMLPYAGFSIDYAIQRLCRLGLIRKVEINKVQFFVEPKNMDRLRSEAKKAVIEDKTEFLTIKRIHEIIMNLYPLHLIKSFSGAVRPRNPEVLRLSGGMTFDIFYQLNNPVGKKRFLVIDVYTRIPVNGYVVNSFIKKIEWAKSEVQTVYNLKERTFGTIVFRNATREAIHLANKNGIRFIRLSDIKINYEDIQKEAELIYARQ